MTPNSGKFTKTALSALALAATLLIVGTPSSVEARRGAAAQAAMTPGITSGGAPPAANPVIPTIRVKDDGKGGDGEGIDSVDPGGRPGPAFNDGIVVIGGQGGGPLNPVIPTIRVKDDGKGGDGEGIDSVDPGGRPAPTINNGIIVIGGQGGGPLNPVIPTIRVKDDGKGGDGEGIDSVDPNG